MLPKKGPRGTRMGKTPDQNPGQAKEKNMPRRITYLGNRVSGLRAGNRQGAAQLAFFAARAHAEGNNEMMGGEIR